jgi:hypothetical protein
MHAQGIRPRTLGAMVGVILVAVVAVGAYAALTAESTVPDSRAGIGVGEITGYDITSVHYVINAGDRSLIDEVQFAVDEEPVPGSTISIRLHASGSWYSCASSGVNVTCDSTSPQATVLEATELTVVVAQ